VSRAREKLEREAHIVGLRRRGVSVSTVAQMAGITPRRVQQICAAWRDEPTSPAPGVVGASEEEVERLILGIDLVLEDLAMLIDGTGHDGVKLGAIRAYRDTLVLRAQTLASAGKMPKSLAAPDVEQQVAAVMSSMIDVLRQHRISEEVVREMLAAMERGMRAGVIDGREALEPQAALPGVTVPQGPHTGARSTT
jgi:hypothetical protein